MIGYPMNLHLISRALIIASVTPAVDVLVAAPTYLRKWECGDFRR